MNQCVRLWGLYIMSNQIANSLKCTISSTVGHDIIWAMFIHKIGTIYLCSSRSDLSDCKAKKAENINKI